MEEALIDHSAHGHLHDNHSMMDHDHAHPQIDQFITMTSVDVTKHDHGSHGDHGSSGGHDAHSMMMMVFHFGCKEVILFEQWSIDSLGGLIASVLFIALMAACYEGLKYYREYLFWKTYNSLQYRAVTLPEKAAVVNVSAEDNSRVHMVGEVIHKQPPTMFSSMHIYQTILHIIQVTLSFMLMLIFMTFNVWLCAAVVFGAAIGYFLFGWKKSVIVDVTEHCH